MRKSVTGSDTNRAVLLQKLARGLKFWIQKEEGLYYSYLCSENKGADDQLRILPVMCAFFRICKKQTSSLPRFKLFKR